MVGGVCAACAAGCASCSGTAAACLSCAETFVLSGSQCICGAQTFLSGTACAICGVSCLRCTSPTACLSCNANYYTHLGQCLLACPDSFFPDSVTGNCESCSSDCPSPEVTWTVANQFQDGDTYTIQMELNGTLPVTTLQHINADTFGITFFYPNGSFANKTVSSVTYIAANKTLNLNVDLSAAGAGRMLQTALFYPEVTVRDGQVFSTEVAIVNVRANFNFVQASEAEAVRRREGVNAVLGLAGSVLVLVVGVLSYLLGHNSLGLLVVSQLLFLNYMEGTAIAPDAAVFFTNTRVLCLEFARPLASLFPGPASFQDSFFERPSVLSHGLLVLLISTAGLVLSALSLAASLHVAGDSALDLFRSERAPLCFLVQQRRGWRWRLVLARLASVLMLAGRLPVLFFSFSTLFYLPSDSPLNTGALAAAGLSLALNGAIGLAGFVRSVLRAKERHLVYHPLEAPNYCAFGQQGLVEQFDLVVQFIAGAIFAFRISGLLRLFLVVAIFVRETIGLTDIQGCLQKTLGIFMTVVKSVFIILLVVLNSPTTMFVMLVVLALGHIAQSFADEFYNEVEAEPCDEQPGSELPAFFKEEEELEPDKAVVVKEKEVKTKYVSTAKRLSKLHKLDAMMPADTPNDNVEGFML